jgi:hypothetical protein
MFLLKLDYSIALNSWAHFISNVISFVYLKVMFARSVDAVQVWFLEFFDSSAPGDMQKTLVCYAWWRGGHALYSVLVCFQSCWSNACDIGPRKSILRGRLGGQTAPVYDVYSPQFSKVLLMIMNTLVLCFLCVVYAPVLHCGHRFARITMGEFFFFFAAVLHWVTRVDDFTKLLVDTCGWVVWQASEVKIGQKIPIKADCCNFMDCTLMQTSLTLLCKQSATHMALLLMK